MWLSKFFPLVFALFCSNVLPPQLLFVWNVLSGNNSLFLLIFSPYWRPFDIQSWKTLWFPWKHYFYGNYSIKFSIWNCCYSSAFLMSILMWFLCSGADPHSSYGKAFFWSHPCGILSVNRCHFVHKDEHGYVIPLLFFSMREELSWSLKIIKTRIR